MLMAALKIAVETNLLENYSKNSKFGSSSEPFRGLPQKIVKAVRACAHRYSAVLVGGMMIVCYRYGSTALAALAPITSVFVA